MLRCSGSIEIAAVSFDHVDVSSLMKEMESLKSNISVLSENQKSSLELIKQIKRTQGKTDEQTVLSTFDTDVSVHDERNDDSPTELDDSLTLLKTINSVSSPSEVIAPLNSNSDSTYADVVKQSSNTAASDLPFTVVQARKKSQKISPSASPKLDRFEKPARSGFTHDSKTVIIGTKRSSFLKGVSAKSSLFISRLSPSTSSKDIESFVKENFNINVECQKLVTKYDTYASFKILLDIRYFDTLLNPSNWPEYVLVRKFFEGKNNGYRR